MNAIVALVRPWIRTEYGLCLTLIVGVCVCVIAPYVGDRSIPLDIPAELSVPPPPAADVGLEERNGWQNAFYLRSYRYMKTIPASEGALLWDTRDYAGKPFLADPAVRAVSPFSLPFYVFGTATAFWVSLFAKLLVAGWSTFYVARVLGLPVALGAYAACVYTLSGTLVVWGAHPAGDVAPWIPLLLLFAERLSLGQWRYWPGGTLLIGAILLSGALVASAASLVFAAIYLAIRRRHGLNVTGSGRAVGIAAGAALALGVLLAAIQLAPTAEWFLHSTRIWRAQGSGPGLLALTRFLGPVWNTGEGMLATRTAALLHIGIVPALLTGLWLALRRYTTLVQRRRIDALLVLGGLWLGVCTLLAVVQGYLPFTRYLPLVDIILPVPFAFALGTGAVASQWLGLGPRPSYLTFRRYTGVLILILGLGVAGFGAVSVIRPIGTRLLLIEIAVVGLTAAVFCLAFGVSLIRPKPRLFGYTLALASALQLLLVYLPIAPKTAYAPLAETATRVDAELNETRVAFGPDARAAGRYAVHAQMLGGFSPRAPEGGATFLRRLESNPGLVRRAGVEGLILSEDDLSGGYAILRPGLTFRSATYGIPGGLFHVDSAAGRVNRLSLGNGDAKDATHRARGRSLLDRELGYSASGTHRARPLIGRRSTPTRIDINVVAVGPETVVLYETYYPGWFAFADTRPVEIARVDGFFRGASVPDGARELTFLYAPATYRWGGVISLATLSFCLFGLAHLTYHRIRNQYFRM